jgi:type II secretory pathway predicted ATPase ExeA
MDRRENPYSPGAGRIPFALAGREKNIDDFETAMSRITSGVDARPIALYGLRGVGKTVLLRELYDRAKNNKWIAAYIEADPMKDFRTLLGQELEDILVDIAKPGAGNNILKAVKTALSFIKFSVNMGDISLGVDLSDVGASNAATGNMSGDLGRLIRDLSELCKENNNGIALLIDEAQELSKEDLRAINTLAHRASQERYRLVIAVAGLPTLPAKLAEVNSYAERLYGFSEIRELDDDASRIALLEPSASKGVSWDEEAVTNVISTTAGFAYFIQEYGSAVWDVAESSPITNVVAEAAKKVAIEHLDTGFFRSRWDRASDLQKAYMRAMAVDDDKPSQTAHIATRLNIEASSLSPRRSELISKGLIYSPQHGTVAFTVPQMASFIRRQADI